MTPDDSKLSLLGQAAYALERDYDVKAVAPAKLLALPIHGQIACKAGCSDCCHMAVSATFPEAVAMVRSLTPDQAARVKARLPEEVAAAKKPGMTNRLWWKRRKPCAMLEDDQCMAYEQRPLSCRRFASFDKADCGNEDSTHEVSMPDVPSPTPGQKLLIDLAGSVGAPAMCGPLPLMLQLAFIAQEQGLNKAMKAAKKLLLHELSERTINRWCKLA